MIAPRRPMRLACAPAARGRALRPPPLRWRRVRRGSAVGAVPVRLVSWIVALQQHLHLDLGPFNLYGRTAPLTDRSRAAGDGKQGAQAVSARMVWPIGSRSTQPGKPWSAPAPHAHHTRSVIDSPVRRLPARAPAAQAPWMAPAPAPARNARLAFAAPAPAYRSSAGSLRGTVRPARPALALAAQPRPALHPLPLLSERGVHRSRPTELRLPQLAQQARALAAPRAMPATFSAAPPTAVLAWRRSATEAAAVQEAAQRFTGDVPAVRRGADNWSTAPLRPSVVANAPGVPALDSAATERLAEDVLRRVERRLRIERERRGL